MKTPFSNMFDRPLSSLLGMVCCLSVSLLTQADDGTAPAKGTTSTALPETQSEVENTTQPPMKKPTLRERLDAELGNESTTPPVDAATLARRVQESMTQAQTAVAGNELGKAVEQQAATLRALDELLAGLNTDSPPSESSSGVSRTETAGITDTPSPMQGDGARNANSSQATESNPDAQGPATPAQQAAQRRRLATSVWGHLPDRIREQLQGSYRERYLPEYADLVEDYYRSLSEVPTTKTP
ncbi:MAG: hypothetical protein R3C01_06955 [Planctomycetaceae bacterium]